jgi:hypothetical protein
MYRVCAFVAVLCRGGGSMLHAADLTILGKRLLVKDPKPGLDPTKRKIDSTTSARGRGRGSRRRAPPADRWAFA